MFANVALTGAEAAIPFGLARVVAGLVFGVGLSLVLLGGAQIFTGDVLMVMAWASGRLAAPRILRAWALVWIGNLVGALGTAALVFLADHHLFGAGQVGVTALRTAEAKAALPFGRAVALGCSATRWCASRSGCRCRAASRRIACSSRCCRSPPLSPPALSTRSPTCTSSATGCW